VRSPLSRGPEEADTSLPSRSAEGAKAGPTDADERLLRMLAGIVGRVYENGRLLYEAERHAAQLAGEVAERKRAEEALRKADANMRFALEAGSVGIWEIDAESGMLTASDTFERIHGWPPGEFARTKDAWLERVHEQDRPAVTTAIAALTRADGIDSEVEYRIPWPDGSDHRIVINGRVVRNASDTVTGIGGVAIDVTEPRQLQAQLVQSQKLEAIGLLAGGVAHDFNNILTAILGYVELLESRLQSDNDVLRDLDEIRKSGTRAADLTRQLLAFSRRQVLRPALIDLNALVQDLANMLRRLIGEDVTLTMTLEKGLSSVMADRGQIEQVIMNLVVNARDALPRGGRLTIATSNAAVDAAFFRRLGIADPPAIRNMVKISVSDTGVGMDAMTRKRIFEPFFTTKGRSRGTGLGLATVYGIVKQSGGFIDVDSTPGKGARFDILLPRAERTSTTPTTTRAEVAPAPRGTETILVVEDDDTVRSLVSSLLKRNGYNLVVFPDGESAAVFAEGHSDRRIDLLLSDVVLPGMSGPELYKQLRVRRPGLRVLFMSGYNDERIVASGALSPDVHSIEKPFTGGGLARKVREVLDIEPRSSQ
jgi:two-component system, cell cycle sensor histidine kinase and response regulator CckA